MNDPFTLDERVRRLERIIREMSGEMARLNERNSKVSGALWCDPGNHAFSANDPDRHRITSENAAGETVMVDMCGTHLPSIFRTDTKEIQDS